MCASNCLECVKHVRRSVIDRVVSHVLAFINKSNQSLQMRKLGMKYKMTYQGIKIVTYGNE